MQLKVKLLNENATLPTRAHTTDLGYDLYASEQISVHPEEWKLVPTGVALGFPEGWGGFIKDRSSVASKSAIHTHAGVIDQAYTGEVKVLLYNAGKSIYTVYRGDKVAQLVPQQVVSWNIVQVNELEETERGSKGFGSSGR